METLKKIQAYKKQRFGVVLNTFIKPITTSKRKTIRCQFVAVLWDGFKTPSEHEQMRLVHEHEFAQVKQDYINAIGG